jgi:ubiquinone/menaquinone biosynthesis C-methylase UbiE
MQERIPTSLEAKDYATVWNKVASVREHAFELVDESQSEEQLAASGRALAPYLIEGLALGAADTVLEIGCGVARLGKEIAPHVKSWWGLDVSSEMVAIARERCKALPNVELRVGNGQDLAGLPDAHFDKVYCHAVFIHMDKEDWYTYLRDARRVLKPGGLFYFDVWNLCDEVGWLRWQAERSLYATRAQRPVHRNQFSSPQEVRMMLRKAGWLTLHFAETFYIQPVVTHAPAGVDEQAFLAELRTRYRSCWEKLRYQAQDYSSFSSILAARLRERGHEPEIDLTPYAP